MDRMDIQAKPREIHGKKVRFLRRQGITPANVSGLGQPSQPIQVDGRAMAHLINRHGRNHLVQLAIEGGSTVTALLKDYKVHPIKNTLIHIDFQRVAATEKLTIEVELNFVGEAPAANKGDLVVLHLVNIVRIDCLPGNLPETIDVDVTSLREADDIIRVGDLKLGPGITLLTDPEEVVARVRHSSGGPKEAAEESESAGTTEDDKKPEGE